MAAEPTGFGRHGYRNLAEKESSCEVTLSDVLSSQNMEKAWKHGMKVGDFPDFAKVHWEKVISKLAKGSYSPSPVRGVQIPKGGGKFRQLGIPTVLDRVIQQAISQVLTPLYEPHFSEHSHGFRPKRSAHGAIDEMLRESNIKGSKCHVVDCDLAAFFDTVDHQKLQSITKYLSNELKLTVNQTKSQVVKLCDASFLGFKIVRGQIWWTEKSREKFKDRIREITKRTRGHSPTKVTSELKMYVRGAMNYYGRGMKFGEARELDSWMRNRMRLYHWKQWGRPRTRRRKLLHLGIGRDEVHKASRSRKGPWRICHTSIVLRAMTVVWLEDQGIPNIEKQWTLIRYPNGPKRPKG
jgi:hypothetical protein